MIQVTITYNNDKINSFKVTGHAGYAEQGEDIYCAGVSAITQTALIGLIKHLPVEPIYKIENGFLECNLPVNLVKEDIEKAQIILSTMELGLISLQDSYSDYVEVVIRRCNND
ncbi:putative ribosomal protein [Candidatus Syntrophocurvum alkaliphilum]|uniref:Ribosomal processing cysteine protease Prp n=1 Tax=Candidatus Syntrophocurvum alkaliphilum TaxID=2293317 RepID=A0A6I6DK53_9FIRM|nr:ribosomal-processing cysteine protease Prp [Candidatus Syntrophocurvum alkaliphilum]QGU00035.1 putative ribosomal protein [Candidatus Syntrophocurvum alkaliphilum]